ncbi:MAG TPA: hypothetical protein VFB32_04780 [Rudaea sp.]|nr:hypothetical protein [Rudaea sp.]
MANARSRYDTIAAYLERAHEAQPGLLYGKPCVMHEGKAFAAYQPDAMAFRLHGRHLDQALAIPGSHGWDPLGGAANSPGWVLIPATHVLRWDRLALDALRCAKEASERRVSYRPAPPRPEPAPEPPPSTPASLAERVAMALSSGLRTLTLSRGE